ncbi:MAG: plasmid pRiA4b ORF-3 family protein [Anaerolineae bacterium]|nr:plasmid pRiA4b ORF-3 family protein [Anaerolineae bacterium]
MARKAQPTAIYQIKVTLQNIHPPIWRRLLVPDNLTLGTLHHIIQAAMDWEDCHLHQFIVGQHPFRVFYGVPDPDYVDEEMKDEQQVKLNQIVTGEKFKFVYEYDFGDSWEHLLVVEKILPVAPQQQYPVCIKGKRACPPEDVGGVWGYAMFLEALANPEHPDHEMYTEWVGGEFDPEHFDLDEINRRLAQLR